ncbi:DNA-packaging protein [Ligilactobacillus salitolerans]|uniref:DNA-packaging protein n=1 Tax=Ligilactobacillus salitolerans TaxID=1808352 RepID=A0A401ITY2_9LACO|nr:head-tail connector protein [Ligilactobacillus salitolerans]GBG94974.1 DNA-packaging protein [Ligilactobacillus salitolerans]
MAENLLSEDQFATLKNYCKVDQDFDDDVLLGMVDSAALMITRAIKFSAMPIEFVNDPRFKIALMKQVKEDYYQRGLTADNYRPELTNSIADIVNQLRSEVIDNEDD